MTKKIKQIAEKIYQIVYSKNFIVFLIITGVILRLNHYFENRSFWLDEAYLALHLTKASVMDIITGIPFYSDAPFPPPGFNFIQKILISAIRNNEYVFRLLPFMAGAISVFLFFKFIKRFANKNIVPLCLALFILSDQLIYYSAELKQYSLDLLTSLLLFISFDMLVKNKNFYNKNMFLCLGILALIFSHPAVFILIGMSIYLIAEAFLKKNKKDLFGFLMISFIWLDIFLALNFYIYSKLTNNIIFIQSNPYLPPFIFSFKFLIWFKAALLDIFQELIGIKPALLWFVIFLIGVIKTYKTNKKKFFILFLPFFLLLCAVFLKKYPFGHRFVLFYIPIFILILGEGILWVSKKVKVKILLFLLFFLLFFNPLKQSFYYLINFREKEDIRSVMQYFKNNYQKQDAIFMNNSAQYAYGYYHGILNIKDKEKILCKIAGDLQSTPEFLWDRDFVFEHEFYDEKEFGGFVFRNIQVNEYVKKNKIKYYNNKRTWLILAHANNKFKSLVLNEYQKRGVLKDKFLAKGAEIYLFNMEQ